MPRSLREGKPAGAILFWGAGLLFLMMALVFNEFLLARFDPTPPLEPETVRAIRSAQAICLLAGLALSSVAALSGRVAPLGRLIDRTLVVNSVLGVMVVLVPLASAELALRPFVERPAALHEPWDVELPPKTPGTYRILAVGGSTIRGYPLSELGIVAQLEAWLRALRPGRRVEVINLGQPSEPSYYVRRTVENTIDSDVDLAIVLTGHNESLPGAEPMAILRRRVRALLTRSALGSLLAGSPSTADGVARTTEPAEYRAALERFARNLRATVEAARARGVPVILLTPPSNLADWAPAYRLQPPDSTYIERVDGARALVVDGRVAEARAKLEELRRQYGEDDAMLSFVQALLFRVEGRASDARRLFVRARDLDPFRWRATSECSEIVRSFSELDGVRVIDMQEVYERHSVDRLVGLNLVADNVHPTPLGYSVMAREVIRAMARDGRFVVANAQIQSAESRLSEFWAEIGQAEEQDRLRSLWARRLGQYAMTQPFHDYEIATGYLRRATSLDPESWQAWANLGTVLLLRGLVEEGWEHLRRAEVLKGARLGEKDEREVPHLRRALEHALEP